ncbi:MAG TPA: phosphotransferase family protein [Candidatus Acidoferrum sp.]|nr:phosphotransferase family protein [Candidatus Acidoferrum sp.]
MADLQDPTAAVRPGEELDVAKLEPFLRVQFPGETEALVVRQYPCGHSNLTYSVQVGQRDMVLRRPPFGSKVKSAHDMGREFRVLSKLHAHYPPAPRVLLFCDDVSVLGAPFYLMEPIHGIILRRDVPPGLDFSPVTALRLSESFLDNLALLHSLDYDAIGLADLGKPQGYLERQVRGWIERYHASKTHDIPEIAPIFNWIQQHVPALSAAALIHNDYKYDNVVLDPSDLTKIIGVLDWEMCTIGDPLTDLGSALAYWIDANDPQEMLETRWGPTTYPGSITRAQLVHRYALKTGRDVSNLPFYLAFARLKIAVIVQQIYYRYHQGLTHDERFASMPQLIKLLLRASLRTAETGAI